MKKKNIVFMICALVVQLAALTYFALYSINIKNSAEKDGRIVKIACTAYDPYHPFKGRYILLTTSENAYIKNRAEYYLQENFADKVDAMNWKDFNELKPVLELYVDSKDQFVIKGVTVLATPCDESSRIQIEEYLENAE